MRKILIFGGHGFLGKNLKDLFDGSTYEILYVSRRDGVDLRNEEKQIQLLIKSIF